MQFPADTHDTELKYADGAMFWMSVPNVAGVDTPHDGADTAPAIAGTPNTTPANNPTTPNNRSTRIETDPPHIKRTTQQLSDPQNSHKNAEIA